MPFMKTRSSLLILLLTLVFVAPSAGCRDKAVTKPDGPVRLNVKDFDGNWIVVITNRNTDEYRWMINFSRDTDGKMVAKIIDARHDRNPDDPPVVTATKIDGNSIRIDFKNSRSKFDFIGELAEGYIRGNIRATQVDLFLVRMLPTDETSLERINPSGPLPGAAQVEQLLKSKEIKPEEIMAAAREMRNSPVAQGLYDLVLARAAMSNLDEATFTKIVEDAVAAANIWGDRWAARVELDMAMRQINGRIYAHLAPAHLDACERKLGEDLEAYRETLKRFHELAEILTASQQIQNPSASDAEHQKAYARLKELSQVHRFNFDILNGIAIQSERNGEEDVVFTTLSQIVALPLIEGQILSTRAGQPPSTPTPGEKLKTIWTKKHGSEDGYEAYLDEFYHKTFAEFAAEIQQKAPALPAADAGNKTVLVELFTNMRNPTSVPAELAVAVAAQAFPRSKMISLEYHQHLPEPDGLVNPDAEERATFYELPNTPLIAINGLIVIPRFYTGTLQNAIKAYDVLRQVIDPELSGKTDVEVKVSGSVTNGELAVSAEAIGIPEARLASCRLRMAIVENDVSIDAPLQTNGIRDHRYVVREMLGGTRGIPVKDGELKYSITMPIDELQRHVIDYIARFEAGRRFEFPPKLKPPIRGPLSFVAWVQDGQPEPDTNAKRILQAAIIPISGEFELIGGGKVDGGKSDSTPRADESKSDQKTSNNDKQATDPPSSDRKDPAIESNSPDKSKLPE